MQKIMVSVVMIVYNHEDYIEQAIESVLMQETDFPFEIVIGEDKSPDRSREILVKYSQEYPDKIKLIQRDDNIGAIANLYDTIMKSSGKYIAFLEGDDYWIDSKKLQKQVDFLEANNDYVAAAHRHKVLYQDYDTKPLILKKIRFIDKRFTFKDFGKYRFQFHGNSLMCKNIFAESNDKYKDLFFSSNFSADYTIILILLDIADVFIMKDIMLVYRFVEAGKSNYYSIIKKDTDKLMRDSIDRHKVIIPYFEKRHDMSYIKASLLGTIAKDAIINKSNFNFWKRYSESEVKVKLLFWKIVFTSWTKWPFRKIKHIFFRVK